MSQKFIGITIGPIYRTFQKAEKTREIWGASYLFSYLCRELIRELKCKHDFADKKFLLPNPSFVFCNPNDNYDRPGVGLYPDRIIIASEEGDFEKVKNAISNVKLTLRENIFHAISKYWAYDPYAQLLKNAITGNEESAKTFLSEYLQVYSVESTPHDLLLGNISGSSLGTIVTMNVLMDHLELRTSIAGFDPDPIKVFLRGINHSFLLKDAFGGRFKHFPSLPEISTTELRFMPDLMEEYDKIVDKDYYQLVKKEEEALEGQGKKLVQEEENENSQGTNNTFETQTFTSDMASDENEGELLEKLFELARRNNADERRTYHKYVAVVHADGDRMGKLIGSLTDDGVSKFSKDLIEFAKAANTVLAGTRFTNDHLTDWGYGASPIYIGGDDLVFFAPVASRNSEGNYMTVFHLIKKLDETFDNIFNARDKDQKFLNYPEIGEKERPCMTYGISITYVKQPLREAFFQSYELMHRVKNDDYKTRNRINFKVQKHSGQWYGGVIDKNDQNSFNEFVKLLDENNTVAPKKEETEQFINSLSQKLRFYQSAIETRAINDRPDDLKIAMAALFENAMDEGVHDLVRPYLDQICNLMADMLIHVKHERERELAARIKNNEILIGDHAIWDETAFQYRFTQTIDTLHGMLRFIHFIRDNEFRN